MQEGKKDKLFADHVKQICEAHDWVILSFHQQVQGLARPQCARVRRCTEEHTLTERQSCGPSDGSGLKMVNWESQSKTPQDSG